MDWIDDPGQPRFGRIKRIMAHTCTRQETKLQKLNTVPTEVPKANLSKIYGLNTENSWEHLGYRCLDCGRSMNQPITVELHGLACDKQLIINRIEENEMPIQRVMKNGTPYYRYGTHGHLYKTKAEAEQQMRAMYAAGYKGKEEKKK